MKRIFLSADIEGVCGAAHWDEADRTRPDYATFSRQMSREAAAACEGAFSAGAEEVLVRDGHGSARNIDPSALPAEARLFRGWAREPMGMMSGLDATFDGVLFTGYHGAAGWSGNPLSHTVSRGIASIRLNGEDCPELMINSLTAAMVGVPVLMVSGDAQLCDWFHAHVPEAVTVPVSKGVGNGSIAMHPDRAVGLIRQGAVRAMRLDPERCYFPMPERFAVAVQYVQHAAARSAGWYPGARQTDSRTVAFSSDQWREVLTFFHFCL